MNVGSVKPSMSDNGPLVTVHPQTRFVRVHEVRPVTPAVSWLAAHEMHWVLPGVAPRLA